MARNVETPTVDEDGDPGAPIVAAVDDATAGVRLDRFLHAAGVHESRSRVKALIEGGAVVRIVTGAAQTGADGCALPRETAANAAYKVRPGEIYEVVVPAPEAATPQPEEIPLDVVFEDLHLIVIDKPAGLVVHPGAGNWTGTLVNALLHHCGDSLSGIGGVRRPGIVHRLDKDTSGLMVVAKTDAAHAGLAAQFAAHGRDGRLERLYEAIVWGVPERPMGTVAAPIGRAPNNRLKMAVLRAGGREAVTHWRRTEVFGPAGRTADPGHGDGYAARLVCALETGRTHQIRVHMASVGHPLLGDPLYGAGFKASERKLAASVLAALGRLERQALHAGVLGFEHPATGEELRFERPPPADLGALISALIKPS